MNEFYNGCKVRVKGEGDEIFTISQLTDSRCWIGDRDNRGWYISLDRLIPVDSDEYDEESEYQSSPEDFE
jgi:hypothetical protein